VGEDPKSSNISILRIEMMMMMVLKHITNCSFSQIC